MFYFKTDKKTIVDILQKIEPIARKNLLPFLECVRIDVSKNHIKLSTTQTDFTICEILIDDEISIDSDSENIYVNATQLLKIVKNTKAGNTIHFESVENDEQKQLRIKTKKTEYVLDGFNISQADKELDVAWTLELIQPDTEHFVFSTTKQIYNESINKVGFACAKKDEFREAYKGVSFCIKDNVIVTTTDGRIIANLSMRDIGNMTAINEQLDGITDFIIPTDMLPHIKRCLATKKDSDPENDVIEFYHMLSDDLITLRGKIVIKHQSGIISFHEVNAEFPDWRKYVYDNVKSKHIVFDVETFKEAVSDALVLKHKTDPVMGIRIEKDQICLKSVSSGVGTSTSVFDLVKNNSDEDFVIRFNCDIVKQFIEKFDTRLAMMRYESNKSGAIFQPVPSECMDYEVYSVKDDLDLDYQYMIMPVHDRTGRNEFDQG